MSETVNYRKRDSASLCHDLREFAEEHGGVVVHAPGRELASADSKREIHEVAGDNRGVVVDGEQVRPEDVVEIEAPELDDEETTEVPTEKMATLVREQAIEASEPNVVAPEGANVDVLGLLRSAALEYVEFADGEVHAAYEGAVSYKKRIDRADRHAPAEYERHTLTAHIAMSWGMHATEAPEVDIEVEHP